MKLELKGDNVTKIETETDLKREKFHENAFCHNAKELCENLLHQIYSQNE